VQYIIGNLEPYCEGNVTGWWRSFKDQRGLMVALNEKNKGNEDILQRGEGAIKPPNF